MHSAHVTYGSLPTTSTALSLCVDYAAEWCAGESAYEGDLFDDPERVEAALRESAAVGVAPASAGVAEVVASRRDALRLVAKPVELRADPESANSERWLLPQLSGLLGALRGTSGCVLLSASNGVALAICCRGDGGAVDEDREGDDAGELRGALGSVCFDPAPRPLFRLRGASALRFTSVRGLQLHVLAVLSSVDDGSDDRTASLALVVSPRRDDGARLRRMEVDATRIRRAEKKRAIERQRAEVAALRSRRDVAPAAAGARLHGVRGGRPVPTSRSRRSRRTTPPRARSAAAPDGDAAAASDAPFPADAAFSVDAPAWADAPPARARAPPRRRRRRRRAARGVVPVRDRGLLDASGSPPPYAAPAGYFPDDAPGFDDAAAAARGPGRRRARQRARALEAMRYDEDRLDVATPFRAERGGDDGVALDRTDALGDADEVLLQSARAAERTSFARRSGPPSRRRRPRRPRRSRTSARSSPRRSTSRAGPPSRRSRSGPSKGGGASAGARASIPDLGAVLSAALDEPGRPAAAPPSRGADDAQRALLAAANDDRRADRRPRLRRATRRRARAAAPRRARRCPRRCPRRRPRRRPRSRPRRRRPRDRAPRRLGATFGVVSGGAAPLEREYRRGERLPAPRRPGAGTPPRRAASSTASPRPRAADDASDPFPRRPRREEDARKARERLARMERSTPRRARARAAPDDDDNARGAARRDAPPPAAKRLSNRRALTNALTQICLAGPHCANQLNLALEALDRSHADNHLVVLKDDAVHTFRGLYALRRGRAAGTSGGPFVDAEKIYGRGPARFGEEHVMKFLKFNSAARAFTPLPSKSFSFTTDAAVLALRPKQAY
ncbi:calmodulin regulated spectrin-associated protein [Aureococcus anophagefferens]|uniref:Calmodulin regulated spectrin-associated protein n=1 Tax=Aureococcus anophagefferens TaxID=44056 RepID=A0ABR1G1R3_AURAN